MKSYFITGTDTDVGKTYVTAGIARYFKLEGYDVGIMKPYAAGLQENQPYKSKDVEILANAAKINDTAGPVAARRLACWKSSGPST